MDTTRSAGDLAVLARLAYDAFYEYKNEHYGTPIKRLYQADKQWKGFEKIAALCEQKHWDPKDFVQHAFQYVDKAHYYVTPIDLINKARRFVGVDMRSEWLGLQNELLQYEAEGFTEKEILLSPINNFPAWFRCLYPEDVSQDILDTWGDLARKEIEGSRMLEEFARKQSPDNLLKIRGEK